MWIFFFPVRRNPLKQGNRQVVHSHVYKSTFTVHWKTKTKTNSCLKGESFEIMSKQHFFLPSATPQLALCSAQPAQERLPPGGRSSVRASSSCRLWGCGWCCTLTESAPSAGFGPWRTCNTCRENRSGSWMAWHDATTVLLMFQCVCRHARTTLAFDLYQQFVVLDDTEQFGPLAEALLPQQECTNPRILDQIHGRLFWRPLVTHLLVLSILLLFVIGLVRAAHGIRVIICQ